MIIDGCGAVQTSGSSNRPGKMALMSSFSDSFQKPENQWFDPSIRGLALMSHLEHGLELVLHERLGG
jgi:hypothetical protein